MKPVSARRQFQTHVIYGTSGGGKTTLAATAPKPAFLDSNQGLLSIAGRKGFEHVVSEDVHSMDDLRAAYDALSGTNSKRRWDKKYLTLCLDHFDDIQDIVMAELGSRRQERRDTDPDEAEQRDYGIMGARMRRLLRDLKKLPVHKILICGEMEDRETGRLKPSLVGALSRQLPYFADNIMYLRIGKKNQRYLHLDSTEEFYAKTRAWWLPPEIRKMKVDFNDTTTLTTLFGLIAAGPKPGQVKDSGTSEA